MARTGPVVFLRGTFLVKKLMNEKDLKKSYPVAMFRFRTEQIMYVMYPLGSNFSKVPSLFPAFNAAPFETKSCAMGTSP